MATSTRRISAEAEDPKYGMTLDEWARFVQAAMRAGASGSERVRVTVNLRAGAKAAELFVVEEIDGTDAPAPRLGLS